MNRTFRTLQTYPVLDFRVQHFEGLNDEFRRHRANCGWILDVLQSVCKDPFDDPATTKSYYLDKQDEAISSSSQMNILWRYFETRRLSGYYFSNAPTVRSGDGQFYILTANSRGSKLDQRALNSYVFFWCFPCVFTFFSNGKADALSRARRCATGRRQKIVWKSSQLITRAIDVHRSAFKRFDPEASLHDANTRLKVDVQLDNWSYLR